MAKATKLPSGNWRMQVSVTINGKKLKKSFTNSNRKNVIAEAAAWQAGLKQEIQCDNITLNEAYKRYITAKENILSCTTIRGYWVLERNSMQSIRNEKISSLTQEQIQRAINEYSANHSPKSVRNCNGLLSAVLSMFRPEFSPIIKLPQKEKRKMYIPTDEDINDLLGLANGTTLELPIMLGAFGALRCGEVCALTSNDVFDNCISVNKSMACDSDGKWHIKSPKTLSSNRTVELPQFVMEKLKKIDGNIVHQNPHSLSVNFRRFLKKNKLPLFRFHDLRHYNVSTLHAMGIPDKYIMQQGGWSTNYTMNNVYNHIMPDKQSEFSIKTSEHFQDVFSKSSHENSHGALKMA